MERIRTAEAGEVIGLAVELIPPRVRERIGRVHHFEGDLFFAGWLSPRWGIEASIKGWGYDPREAALASYFAPRHRPVAHVAYWDSPPKVSTVLHELGHALQWALGSHWWRRGGGETVTVGLPAMVPLTNNCPDDYVEQFAEAFCTWLLPYELRPERERRRFSPENLYLASRRTRTDNRELLGFFNQLAGLEFDTPPVALR